MGRRKKFSEDNPDFLTPGQRARVNALLDELYPTPDFPHSVTQPKTSRPEYAQYMSKRTNKMLRLETIITFGGECVDCYSVDLSQLHLRIFTEYSIVDPYKLSPKPNPRNYDPHVQVVCRQCLRARTDALRAKIAHERRRRQEQLLAESKAGRERQKLRSQNSSASPG